MLQDSSIFSQMQEWISKSKLWKVGKSWMMHHLKLKWDVFIDFKVRNIDPDIYWH